jgi:signal transduction histidine kinase
MRWFWQAFGVFLCAIAGHSVLLGATTDVNPEHFTFRIQSATLTSPLGERTVTLPHVLVNEEFNANGSNVRFRMNVNLPQAPKQPLGVFINKISLAGALYLNGQLIDKCAVGDIDRLRCLHHPLLFKPATKQWHAGNNTLEIEVHGNHGQVNGMSEVWVDDAQRLHQEVYFPRFLRSITLNAVLGFAIFFLGMLSLVIGASLREESIYRWYGLSSLSLTASLSNLIADQLPLSMHFWNWLIITSRLLAAHFFLLTCLHLFDKHRPWHTRWTIGYAFVFAIVFYCFSLNRVLVSATYLPMLLITPVLAALMVKWTFQSGKLVHVLTCLLLIFMFFLGGYDWLMFSGQGSFEFVYLSPFGFSASMVFIGFLLISHLVDSLRSARDLSIDLDKKINARTKDLESALVTIQQMELTALKLTDAIPVGTFVLEVSKHGTPTFSFLSKRWMQILNVTREAVTADPIHALSCIHPEDSVLLLDKFQQIFKRTQDLTWEGRVLIRGEMRWLSVEAVTRVQGNGIFIFEGVLIDITVHKETQASLQVAHEKLLKAVVQQSKTEEREQLLQEMHDGFGSHLAIARLIAEAGDASSYELSLILQECMADLYLVTDTLSNYSNNLGESFADMRGRMAKLTAHLPIELIWEIDLDAAPDLSQRTILQLLRIILEATNNALKHSQATHIRISAAADSVASQLMFSVTDNGVGLPDKMVKGRGWSNMNQRTRLIGGILIISPNNPGTCVSLTMPLSMP